MQQSELNTSAPGELISYGRKSYYNPDPLPPSRDLTLGNDFYERSQTQRSGSENSVE